MVFRLPCPDCETVQGLWLEGKPLVGLSLGGLPLGGLPLGGLWLEGRSRTGVDIMFVVRERGS